MLEAKAILREAPTNIAGGFRKPIKLEQHRTIVSARFAGSFPPIRVAKLCARLTVSHIFCMHSDRVVKSLPPPQLCCHHSCAICSTLFILYNLIRHCQYICFWFVHFWTDKYNYLYRFVLFNLWNCFQINIEQVITWFVSALTRKFDSSQKRQKYHWTLSGWYKFNIFANKFIWSIVKWSWTPKKKSIVIFPTW